MERYIIIKTMSAKAKKITGRNIENEMAVYYEKGYQENCLFCNKPTFWELDYGYVIPIGKDCLEKHFKNEKA